jgi:hypothetical protein
MTSDLKQELVRLATTVDHTVTQAEDGQLVVLGNDAANAYGDIRDTLNFYRTRWNASLVGAGLVQLFRSAPWLESFTLELSAESEYDDHGGSYRSITLRAPDAQALTGAVLPDDVQGNDDAFCEDAASEWIEAMLVDNVSEVYGAFVEDYSYEDLSFDIRRKTIADLVESGEPGSGTKAFELLFPDCAWRVKTPEASDGADTLTAVDGKS